MRIARATNPTLALCARPSLQVPALNVANICAETYHVSIFHDPDRRVAGLDLVLKDQLEEESKIFRRIRVSQRTMRTLRQGQCGININPSVLPGIV